MKFFYKRFHEFFREAKSYSEKLYIQELKQKYTQLKCYSVVVVMPHPARHSNLAETL